MARLQGKGAASDSALDLAGYVEFNRNFKWGRGGGVGGAQTRGGGG
jgi:hypothetical protein